MKGIFDILKMHLNKRILLTEQHSVFQLLFPINPFQPLAPFFIISLKLYQGHRAFLRIFSSTHKPDIIPIITNFSIANIHRHIIQVKISIIRWRANRTTSIIGILGYSTHLLIRWPMKLSFKLLWCQIIIVFLIVFPAMCVGRCSHFINKTSLNLQFIFRCVEAKFTDTLSMRLARPWLPSSQWKILNQSRPITSVARYSFIFCFHLNQKRRYATGLFANPMGPPPSIFIINSLSSEVSYGTR